LALDPGSAALRGRRERLGETIQEQTAQALRTIAALLKAARTTLDKAVRAVGLGDAGPGGERRDPSAQFQPLACRNRRSSIQSHADVAPIRSTA
jgi:enamine deaminase RidA (YjgF/YER057c/UK114 family)